MRNRLMDTRGNADVGTDTRIHTHTHIHTHAHAYDEADSQPLTRHLCQPLRPLPRNPPHPDQPSAPPPQHT